MVDFNACFASLFVSPEQFGVFSLGIAFTLMFSFFVLMFVSFFRIVVDVLCPWLRRKFNLDK